MSKIVGIAVLGTVTFIILNKYSPEYAIISQICTVIIIAFLTYPYLCNIIDVIHGFNTSGIADSSFVSTLLKSLGISIISQFTSGLCKDNGASVLASQVEFYGKLFMIVTVIPVILEISELTKQIIEII